MSTKMILAGDVNLMNVIDALQPFRLVRDALAGADIVFANLECLLFQNPAGQPVNAEGFFADPVVAAEALRDAGIDAVGIANNVNYGADAITASVARLAEAGIPSTGAGRNRGEAHGSVILEKGGLRFGFLQRSSVFWETNHEAEENLPGIAVVRAHTAYQVPMYRPTPGSHPLNRPGLPPVVVTWADPKDLGCFTDELAALRAQVDVVVASCHWGVGKEILQYMSQIAHTAIDSGADVVIGHGPHYALPVEVYKGRPIYYGLGGFSFHTGHRGIKHGNWVGMMAEVQVGESKIESAGFRLVRHNDQNETVLRGMGEEAEEYADIAKRSAALGTRLHMRGDAVEMVLHQ